MEHNDMIDMLVREKKLFLKLTDISSLTGQLADAADRNDQVSIKLLLSMRQDPLLRAGEIKEEIKDAVLSLKEDDAIRIQELLDGAEPETEDEKLLREQLQMNDRLLERTVELDRRVSATVGGDRSFYKKYFR